MEKRTDTSDAVEQGSAPLRKAEPAPADRLQERSKAGERDRWMQDILEDDEVREVLRLYYGGKTS